VTFQCKESIACAISNSYFSFRWVLLQEVLNNWQEYRDEERRLSKWLSEKENEVDRLKHVDLGDPDAIAHHLQKLTVCPEGF